MKHIFLVLYGVLMVLRVSAFSTSYETNEIIRKKIENQKMKPIEASGDLIYCVETLSKFYEDRTFTLVWDSKANLDQLIKSIEESEGEGLNPKDYHYDKLLSLTKDFTRLSSSQKAEIDLLATDAFLLYTSHLLSGKVNPINIDPEWFVKRREGNPVQLLSKALQENSISQSIKETLPKHTTYNGLKKALQFYQTIKKDGGWNEIPDGELLKKGDQNDRIALVKKRLIASQCLKKNDTGELNQFDEKLYAALILFQKRHNLDVDGSLGKLSIAAMNVSVDDRINQIKVNLERWRWLPQEYSKYYVLVNIANFSVEVFKDGINQRQYKAIVGKNFRRTPVFSSKITYLVLNPTWTVPPTIINEDIIPAVKKDSNYLKKKNLIVLDPKGNSIDPSTIDWNSTAPLLYNYQQPAGPENALGAVKFMFPNSYSVYLHDTPSRELFDKSERSFSSGCIRVQHPLLLAEYFINDSTNWNLDKIKKQIESKKTLTVSLKNPPDIHILYWTAWTTDEGIIQFRKDIYDRDLALSTALKAEK